MSNIEYCVIIWAFGGDHMRLSMSKSKNSTSLYVIKSTYENGRHSSKIIEKLGTLDELKKKLGDQDLNLNPVEWAREYVAKLNKKEKENAREVIVKYSPSKLIEKGAQHSFNGGYLFIKRIYRQLGLSQICADITNRRGFAFDLDSILSMLVFTRIIYPASKRSALELSKRFIEPPDFELHHIYRALEVIAKEGDYIQSQLYKNSLAVSKRNTGILYYDCTNYFFEIEQEEGLKQYGYSKEHRPNPIVEMGLFIDGDGIPLALSIHDGNTNEQLTMTPLEEKILKDFKLSRFIVCTDAGLASAANRKFNDRGDRAFITTQSLKKLKKHLKDWALACDGWKFSDDGKIYDISKIDKDEDKDKTFYKERWINEDGLEQKLVVTYSLKYRDYQRTIRQRQVERAGKVIKTNPTKLKKCNQNDYKRFIQKTALTQSGEAAQRETFRINSDLIAAEEAFDGFYAVCTNLEDDAPQIIKLNHGRWEIEECFRIMKHEFKARPVYLSRDDRIKAHFTTCFLSLVIFRFLEKKLGGKYTCPDIIQNLKDMNFSLIKGEGYVPSYTRNDFTDDLHDAFGFRTDYQIINNRHMKNIFAQIVS